MPVYLMKQEMPYDEFIKWFEFFDQRPVGWRDDLRAYYLMSAFGTKAKPEEIFPSLAKINKDSGKDRMVSTLKNSSIFAKMLASKGGEKPAFLEELANDSNVRKRSG